MVSAAPQPDLAILGARIRLAMEHLAAACAAFCEKMRARLARITDIFRRCAGFVPAMRRLLWTGIARRHAERRPMRGYWLRRCTCLACRERKGLA